MNKIRFTLKACAFLVVIFACSSAANAQATRTWVSGVGDDVNPCSRTAPCKTWAGAISKTAAGGEMDALDPGGYGTLTITKSITVDGTNGAGFGSTLNSGGISGFTINDSATGTPNTSTVRLRNLSINGTGTTLGTNGIRFIAGKALHVENVVIENQSGDGINFAPTAASIVHEFYARNVSINNVTSDCMEFNSTGVGSLILASIDDVSLTNSGNGVRANNNSRVHIRDAQIATMDAGGAGILVAVATGEANVENSFITNNPDGLKVTAGTARISNSFATGNTNGLNNVGGTLIRFNNNMVDGNTSNTLGVITPASEG